MAEKPILFSGEMVRAILDGRKTQTRRVIKPATTSQAAKYFDPDLAQWPIDQGTGQREQCPYGQSGDTLWVRETWAVPSHLDDVPPREFSKWGVWFRADGTYATLETHGPPYGTRYPDESKGKWRPSIFMPRWASRITLEVTAVRVERVQEINDADAIAEGIIVTESADLTGLTTGQPTRDFKALWDSINEKRGYGWESNPWVWVVEFAVVGRNDAQLLVQATEDRA